HDQIAVPGNVLDGISNQANRLCGRMKVEILASATLNRADGCIIPDVRAIAAMLAKFDHVEVRGHSHPVDKNELMLGAVERSHPGVRLVPDTEVQKLAIPARAERH